jgi:hypothetical protein
MHDHNNVFYAVALSVVLLISWQYFFATSFLGKPAASKTSVAAGMEIRPQAQAIGTEAAAPASVPRSRQLSRTEALARALSA